MTDPPFLQWAVAAAMVLLLLGLACAFARMVKGPSMADRVVALDMVSMLLLAFSGVAAVGFDEPAFLDVAITLALIAFLGTVAFARYVERVHARACEGVRDAADPAGGSGR